MEHPRPIRLSWGIDWPTSASCGGFQPPERARRDYQPRWRLRSRLLPYGSLDFAFIAAHNAQQFGEFDERVQLKERTSMRAFRIGGYWLMLFSLLGISSCTRKLATVPTGCDASTKTCTVTIVPNNNSCVAAGQETQDVPLDYSVIWANTNPTQYSAKFWQYKTPFHTPNFSGAGVPSVPAGPPGQKATGDGACNPNASTGCYFPYYIYKDGQKCGDPGIHVVN